LVFDLQGEDFWTSLLGPLSLSAVLLPMGVGRYEPVACCGIMINQTITAGTEEVLTKAREFGASPGNCCI
jgi:hypothetical protein